MIAAVETERDKKKKKKPSQQFEEAQICVWKLVISTYGPYHNFPNHKIVNYCKRKYT